MKMSGGSTDPESSNVVIITTDEYGTRKPTSFTDSSAEIDLDHGFRHQKKSRSFVRQTKSLSNEHRNSSLPHSLQV